MIIKIGLENYKSIREYQEISFECAAINAHYENTFSVTTKNNDKGYSLLKYNLIFGHNASGKSNFVKGIAYNVGFIGGAKNLSENDAIIAYEPCKFGGMGKPSSFYVEFIIENIKYTYFFAYNSDRVIEESLYFYPSNRKALIFSRKNDSYKFGKYFKGNKDSVKNATLSNQLALSKASTDNRNETIRRVYNYFNDFNIGSSISTLSRIHNISAKRAYHDQSYREALESFLKFSDLGLSGIIVEKEDAPVSKIPKELMDDFKINEDDLKYRIMFLHDSKHGDASMEIYEQSAGTEHLFQIAPALITSLQTGGFLILDEFDSYLHPYICEMIIKIFNDPEINRRNAQLLITTHNIDLMSSDIVRRDQVWFTEKEDGRTNLYCLYDFKDRSLRNNTNFGEWYLQGKFGAIPDINLKDFAKNLWGNDGKKTE